MLFFKLHFVYFHSFFIKKTHAHIFYVIFNNFIIWFQFFLYSITLFLLLIYFIHSFFRQRTQEININSIYFRVLLCFCFDLALLLHFITLHCLYFIQFLSFYFKCLTFFFSAICWSLFFVSLLENICSAHTPSAYDFYCHVLSDVCSWAHVSSDTSMAVSFLSWQRAVRFYYLC